MEKVAATVKLHFDGDIAAGHQIPIRVLGQSLLHMQKAIDRAYLDIKYGGVWKNARMKSEDYEISEFIAQAPQEGGYIFDFFSSIRDSARIVDRVSSAINEAKAQASLQIELIKDQAVDLKQKLESKLIKPIGFQTFFRNKNNEIIREYGDRSIAKEIDQVVAPLRQDYSGDSNLVLVLAGTSSQKFEFDRQTSNRFHQVVARRNLSKPLIYRGKLKVLDKINLRGKFENTENNKISIIHFGCIDDLLKAHPFLGTEAEMVFIGSPIIEFGSIEPNSGDVYFLNIANTDDSKDVA